ncbi:lytic transglycosylase domain-containing protein [Hoeflea prorocentri]|uniref:Lytic transglycosylase domain-containing protein n=1 Tax=Hoeflea prorocentri TaxID=1922333 RepID=A0A9X3UHK0_9HYPH|nr:lytic transglycosylase domain-containing protein [Hoeflea prorocentri]MCY6381467.1 lytic transglycosylase domain-containing protein [Hoeflea prorocentri]MDA5399267.1 lytic transglycosylase domain-containing protein [Hoeflea prorocentri]
MLRLAISTLLAVSTSMAVAPAANAEIRPSQIPVPKARPASGAPLVQQAVAANTLTASIHHASNPAAPSGQLKKGLDALSDDEIERARSVRDNLPAGSLDRQILTWAIAVSGARGVPSSDIAAAASQLPNWPGLSVLRQNSERALAREGASAQQVIAAFGNTKPETLEGAVALTRALVATGQKSKAASIIAPHWRGKVLDRATEKLILKEFSGVLTKADHKRRMDMLLYRDRITQADRVDALANAQSLFKARAAVIRKSSKAASLMKAVHPTWHNDASYLFTRISYHRRKKNFDTAAKLLLKAPRDPEAQVDTREWWVESRIVSRAIADTGDMKTAYRIAANHAATRPADIIEAEWHAGWYALRGGANARTASAHFQKVLDTATRPLSISRGYYWLGRAAEAGGTGNAPDYFNKAASFSATYYGQLAAARLNRKGLQVRYPKPTAAERTHFASRQAVRAIQRLTETGHGHRARRLYIALARELTNPGELAILAAMAEKKGEHRLALQVGKIAFGRGLNVTALAFPTGVIPGSANISGSGKALAYAIARQESAFDKAAISKANARGLLQLLPATAKSVARKNGMSYSKARLTSDAGYNATLGAHYLGEHIADFDGSYVLTFIAYNAGPRRSRQWIEKYGDPRGKSIDYVVDWVEQIPFTETRNYVQRVMENYQVYKARLGQNPDIVADLRYGRR